jgi:rRNA processing protein Krr1/Pno1
MSLAVGGDVASGVVTEEIDCPQAKVGTVIGARGIIVQEIMRQSGCKIVVNQDGFPNGAPRKVVITGQSHQIPIAVRLINAVIAEGPAAIQTAGVSDSSDASALQIAEMDCPADKVGIVIGSKGIIIQDIMRRSGCKIVVNQQVPPGEPSIIQITGKSFQIAEAKKLITAVILNGPLALNNVDGSNALEADVITEEMECPADKVGIIIGAKGVIINEIMRRSGTKIVINQDVPAGTPNIAIITGPRYRINLAKSHINNVILNGPNVLQAQQMGVSARPTVHEFTIVQAQVGKLIGPGGSIIKEIQQVCGVRINIEAVKDTDQRIVRISGEPDRVLHAIQTVWVLLQQQGGRPGGPQTGGRYHDRFAESTQMSGGAGWGAPQAPQGWMRGQNPNEGVYQQLNPAVAAPGVQYLGADGKAGQLLPAANLGGGYHHQVALLQNPYFEILCGGPSAPNLALIRAKSGARVTVDESASERDHTVVKIDIVGYFATVSLAAQMIQEVCI